MPTRSAARFLGPIMIWPERLLRLDVEAALRAALCVTVPLLVLLALGRMDLAAYVSFAAFTSLYGRYETYKHRTGTLLVAAGMLSACILAGLLYSAFGTAATGPRLGGVPLVFVLILVVVSGVGMLLSAVMNWVPYGSIFFVFAFSVVSSVPVAPGQVLSRFLVSLGCCLFCLFIGLSGGLVRALDEHNRVARGDLHVPGRNLGALRNRAVWASAGTTAGAVAVATLAVAGLGLGHAYWAACAVCTTMPRPGQPLSLSRIAHRVIGTAGGVLVTAGILVFEPPVWMCIVVVGIAQLLAELFVGQVYWLAMFFVTPLALVSSQLSAHYPVHRMLPERFTDTLVGGLVVLALLLVSRLARKRRGAQAGRGVE
ncbi:FUSC family protein [Brevibacterium sp. 91QC2O2]|uniref:FUSC family protein n=1 Tax=Brevibacterium TaxID=1696 RepID=UPI00211CBE1A|nr:FUSC family protein [Brevibacterium sp. 91QC2O2]MCQ9384096.1 FUSC family protein [Brevibacterium sp. 68QC2CO]